MASSVPTKAKLGLPREDVEELLMLESMFLESEKSIAEVEKTKGFTFLLEKVRDWKPFQESFDKLVSKGCSPYILLHGLNHLLETQQQQTSCRLPTKREVRSLETSLRKSVESILVFEKKYEQAHRTMVFSHCVCAQNAGPEEFYSYCNRRDLYSDANTPCLTERILSYAEMLRAWWTPRSDAIHAYASVHNCVYAKMITGEPQFSIVAKLNSSFLGGRGIQPDTLRKSLSRFEKRKFHSRLVAQLNEAHCLVPPAEPFDWALWRTDTADNSK